MVIRDFTENNLDLEGVDLIDDLHFFMHNDPKFYRRVMYPLISKLRDHVKGGKSCKDTVFRKCVDHAVDTYCNQYRIPGDSKSVFTDVDRDSLARKIFNNEVSNINTGVYDGREGDSKREAGS